jgi:precorrin-2 dehydrogenase/sirohydrochlorin ferrochelatase
MVYMAKYPIFLELANQRAVLIGGGTVAARKAQALITAGARLIVIAEETDPVLEAICRRANAKIIRGRYSKEYLAGALLAIAATNNPELNRQIHKDCQQLQVLCNVADAPQHCDFFIPAVVNRGSLQIAISTEGWCPAYAGHLRKKLGKIFTPQHGEFLDELMKLRKQVITELDDPAQRKALLGQLVDDASFNYFIEHSVEQWRQYAGEVIREHKSKAATG